MVPTKKLWEYLACVFIVGVVAAVMFPVFASGHRNGPSSACLSHMKQLTTGQMLYAADNGDRLPPSSVWQDALAGNYLKSPGLHCPLAPGRQYGYAMLDAQSGAKLTEMSEPVKVPILIESIACIPNAHGNSDLEPRPGRHSGRNATGFGDGHVKRMPVQ